MKAAICYKYGEALVIEDVNLDPPKQNEVKVRIVVASICHSDIHIIRGERTGSVPVLAGHEASGIVENVGPNVTLVRVGDRVVVSLLRSCGYCYYCSSGAPHKCEAHWLLDDENRVNTKNGEPIRLGLRTGAFAEYVIVHESQLVKIPNDIPFDHAAVLACGVITGYGAVVNTANVKPGESVVVIGTGGVGLNSIQAASISGASPIIAVDILDNKLQAAKQFGATHTINTANQDTVKIVGELTLGHGVDYVFVGVGSTSAVSQALKLVRKRGSVIIAGIPKTGETMPLIVDELVGRELRVIGSSMGGTRLRTDIPKLIDLYKHGWIKLEELIQNKYPIEQINEAIKDMENGNAIKNVIVFE